MRTCRDILLAAVRNKHPNLKRVAKDRYTLKDVVGENFIFHMDDLKKEKKEEENSESDESSEEEPHRPYMLPEDADRTKRTAGFRDLEEGKQQMLDDIVALLIDQYSHGHKEMSAVQIWGALSHQKKYKDK